MPSGVYRIRNLVNDKVYVGSTKNFVIRWRAHKRLLRSNWLKHHNLHLQHAWDKYGEDAFVFEIILHCEPIKEVLLSYEQIWLDSLCSYFPDFGYNLDKVAGSGLGSKRSEKFCKKMSLMFSGEKSYNAKLNWLQVREIREKYKTGNYSQRSLAQENFVSLMTISAIIHNKSWRDGNLDDGYQHLVSEIAKKKMHESFLGKKHSEAAIKKMSEVQSGKKLSEETKEKLAKINRGKKYSEETKRKHSIAGYKRKQTEATKKKLSEARRGEDGPGAKLTWETVRLIREKYSLGNSNQYVLAKEYGLNQSSVSDIVRNKTWQE